MELTLVLLVAFSGSLTTALYWLRHGPPATPGVADWQWLNALLRASISLVLLGYVLSRSGRRFRDIGFAWSWRDLWHGLWVFSASRVAYLIARWVLYSTFLQHALRSAPSGRDFFGQPSLAASLFILINPFFEELIVRAYLMTEVRALTGSMALAVAASVLFQTAYHLYYGWWGAALLGVSFLVLSLYFARYQRALPVVIAHAIADLAAFARL